MAHVLEEILWLHIMGLFFWSAKMPGTEGRSLFAYHRLKALSVTGGFLDGLKIEFSSGLNCFIGARGTGKTTVLEFVRYALQQMPSENVAKKRIESLITSNLKGGCIRLTIETKDGLLYTVSRTAGEDAIVMDSKGQPTDISLASTEIFKVNVFSQNEVEGIADSAIDQLRLIDSFESESIRETENKVKQVVRSLATNALDCMDLQKKMAGLGDELATLSGIEAKLSEFAAAMGGDSAEINQAQNQKALRDRERRAMDSISQGLRGLAEEVSGLSGKVEQRFGSGISRDILDGKNGALLQDLAQKLQRDARAANRLLQEARSKVEESLKSTEETNAKIAAAHRAQELEFQNLLAKHKEVQVQSSERAGLEKSRNDLLAKSRIFEESGEKLKRLQSKRDELLRELASLRGQRFKSRQTIIARINKAVMPQIRVKIEQFGNGDLYRELLEKSLKGAGLQHGTAARKIASRIPPGDFVEIVRDANSESLAARAELNADQARKTIAAVSESGMLFEIETVELPDLPSIELQDGGEYKDSLTLSTGQKCTSILPILLLDSVSPLLIDQPEDNLDNRFIYTTVVKRLREVKRNRQMVFLTHNANVPVLADADRVFVMKSTGTLASKETEGTVDECKSEIVTLLEGGEEAFKERRKRYSY